nr:Chain P, BRADYKININ-POTENTIATING PEPTIDE B [Gloydius blomhoffii]prf//700017A bradykinin potentiating peptide B [Gloydius blomhoffii]
EGLPPRPKIPP